MTTFLVKKTEFEIISSQNMNFSSEIIYLKKQVFTY